MWLQIDQAIWQWLDNTNRGLTISKVELIEKVLAKILRRTAGKSTKKQSSNLVRELVSELVGKPVVEASIEPVGKIEEVSLLAALIASKKKGGKVFVGLH